MLTNGTMLSIAAKLLAFAEKATEDDQPPPEFTAYLAELETTMTAKSMRQLVTAALQTLVNATAIKQAEHFMRRNMKYRVVSASAHGEGMGGTFRLKNGESLTLHPEAWKHLEAGYPLWETPDGRRAS